MTATFTHNQSMSSVILDGVRSGFTVYLSDVFVQCDFQIEAFSSHTRIQKSTTKLPMV